MIQDAAAKDPAFVRGRKLVYILLAVMLAARIVETAMQLIFGLLTTITPFNVFLLLFSLLLAFLFAALIYFGVGQSVLLLLLGGIFSFWNLYRDGLLALFRIGSSLFDFTLYSVLIAASIQIIVAVCLLVLADCRAYIAVASAIQKELAHMQKKKS